jgi:hypothetical protein
VAYPGDFRGHVPTLPGHVGGAPFFATSDPGLQQKQEALRANTPPSSNAVFVMVWVKTPTREAFQAA